MTLTDYQTAALRTAGDELPPLWYLALGLCGEAGEVANLVKKFERHGKPFDAAQVADELGDVLWYLAVAAKAADLTLDEVASRNVAKLRARYPDGFVPAGGGADADRVALGAVLTIRDATGRRHAVADHFVGVNKMVAAPVTTEQPALPALRPMDDGVRCGEWCTDGFDLKYTNGRRASTIEQLGANMFKATLFEAKFNPDSKIVSLSSWSLLGVQLAAEAWLRERHPFFDADWPGRHGNPPRGEGGAP